LCLTIKYVIVFKTEIIDTVTKRENLRGRIVSIMYLKDCDIGMDVSQKQKSGGGKRWR